MKKRLTDYEIQNYKLQNAEEGIRHMPFREEERLFASVENGDLEGVSKILEIPDGLQIGKMSNIPKKQSEYMAVVGVSLMARAAIRGGMNPYDAYDLNDLYLQKISESNTEEEYIRLTLAVEAQQEFAKGVRKAKGQKSHSIHVEKAKSFIARHMNRPFSVQELAEEVGVTPNYLSAVFKRDEQITIKEYVLKERIGAAQNMLKFSDATIAQISEYLCFHSQSHFGAVFKRLTGESPASYRRLHRAEGF